MSISQATLLRDFVEEFGCGRAGTATSASTTTLVDAANFGGPQMGGMFPNGSPVRITSGAAINGKSRRTAIDPSTGTITIDPAVTGNTGTPTFVISSVIDDIDRLIEAINRTLTRDCDFWQPIPVTTIPDGDFLGDVATAHWTSGGAGSAATPSYVTLSMANGWFRRCLNVQATDNNGYAESDEIPVEAGETRQFSIWMRRVDGDASFVAHDVINASTIPLQFSMGAATTQSRGFIRVAGTYVVPAGCSLVTFRLGVTTAGDIAQFAMFSEAGFNQRTFASQPHLEDESFIGRYMLPRYAYTNSTTQQPENVQWSYLNADGITYGDFGWGIGFNMQEVPGFPLFYEELSYFPELTGDADTTDCNEELVKTGAAIQLFSMLTNQSRDDKERQRWAQQLAQAVDRWESGALRRLRARRLVKMQRTYARAVSAY